MPTTKSARDTYLYRPSASGVWFARVTVPRTLVKLVGSTHIKRSLRTSSKAEANLRKHAVVGKIKADLVELRRRPPAEAGMSFADAKAFLASLEAVREAGDDDRAADLELVAVDHAERLERLVGHDMARRWYRAATSKAETLKELQDKWLGSRDFKESTKMGHRKALSEVLAFLRNENAYPVDLTAAKALQYIDDHLMTSGLAANTIRDRLVSLGGFWAWLGSRNLVPRAENPWRGHHIAKKRHLGNRPGKRKGGFTDDELVRLLRGDERVKAWDAYSYIPDLIVLGMFTGARLESIAALEAARVEPMGGGYILRIINDKSEAGTRPVGVVHPAAVEVIKQRLKRAAKDTKSEGRLFGELRQGGADSKWSAAATKAFGRYRRALDVPDGTDFHSFRRGVAGILEGDGLTQADLARWLGHKVGTLAADVYAGQRAARWALEVARKVSYPEAVEAQLAKVG